MGWYCYVKKNLQKVISLDIVTLHDSYLIQKMKTSHSDEKKNRAENSRNEIWDLFLGTLKNDSNFCLRFKKKKKQTSQGGKLWEICLTFIVEVVKFGQENFAQQIRKPIKKKRFSVKVKGFWPHKEKQWYAYKI